MKKCIDTAITTNTMINAFVEKATVGKLGFINNLEEALAAAMQEAPEVELRLDSPAKVNGGIFGKNIPWKTVIEAAQRQYKWHMEEKAKPAKTPEQLAEEQRLLEKFFGKPPVTLTGDIVDRIRALPVGFAGSGTYVRLEDVLEIIEGAKFKAPKLPERFG